MFRLLRPIVGINPTDVINRRIDITYFTSSKHSVMNGDPDNTGNQRVDSVTGKAIVTPVSAKSWIRMLAKQDGKTLYIDRNGPPLESLLKEASEKEVNGSTESKSVKKKASKAEKIDAVATLAERFWDIRLFGGALTSPVNEQVTGPVQFTFGESLEPITTVEYCITRGVVTKEADLHKERTMGRLPSVPFAVYRTSIHINPFCARRVNTTYQDLDDMLYYLVHSFDAFKSTIRSDNRFVKMFIFVHPNENGVEASHKLTGRVKTTRLHNADWDGEDVPATDISDYEISVDDQGLSDKSVTLQTIE